MPAMGWVAIGVAVAGMLFTVVWYLVQRRVTRLDLLEQAVFGETGVRSSLSKFVSHDHLTKRIEELKTQMLGVSEEGTQREERILEAIRANGDVVTRQMSEVRQDLRDQGKRIDLLFRPKTSDDR